MRQTRTINRQSGAVSLFIVIFTALLLTIVTISFVQLMLSDQRQATNTDLSQSAYDSAQAGVEDAKRLLLLNQACEAGAPPVGVSCSAVKDAITSNACDTLARGGIVTTNERSETIIQQNAQDNALDQAYTCVKIATSTDDYLGSLQVDQSMVVPLRGESSFSKIELSWFSRDDLSGANPTVEFPTTGSDVSLPQVGSSWKSNFPALLRMQLIQVGSSFKLDDFNDSRSGKSNANTLFLYPSRVGLSTKDLITADTRYDSGNAPQLISCRDNLAAGGYACTVTITTPEPIDGDAASRTAFLRLSAIYNATHFSIKLLDVSNAAVKFSNVQPQVDSTGRANDLFRRVVARVELKSNFNYPDAEIDLTGNLCKNFSVTNSAGDYNSTCTP